MMLCLLPSVAFAKDMSWTWTVTIIGGKYYNDDGTEFSINRYKINKHLDDSIEHEIGYTFQWDAGAGGTKYNDGWQLCLTVDGKIVEESRAYIYEKDMRKASDSWTAPASSHIGNTSHPFTLYLSDYPERFQKITLTYNANGGANPPASETKQVEKGQSATFKVSAIEPTKENYTFKGWSTAENATTAEYKGGDSITIRQNTILYAVWANHEHKDENGDGYCDTDHECMHEKDQDGYCIVDGCTHPHEGDGACCPKKSDNKPERPEPENTSKPFIELTGEKAVKVHCTNDKANHDDKIYGLMHDGYTVGEVQGDKENGYTCDITVNPDKYVDQYNLDIEGGHKLDPESQIGKIKLKWKPDDTGDNTGSWEVVSGVPVVFDVKCDNTQPPLDNIPIEVSKVWEDDIPGAPSITVGLYANGIKVKNATIRPDSEGTWFHRFDNMPANDSNGNPINYTVKEENIPDGYTPHYFTSGAHYGKLVFRVKNVPTEKTGAIKVSKELSGEGAEKDKEFAFTVTLLEYLDSNEVLDGGEPGYYPLSGIYTFGGFEFRDGKVTFGLKGGESVTISGIPAEYDYTVTESNNAGYTVTSENDKGTIRAKGTAEVKFTNTKSAAPTVSPTPTPTPTPGGGNGGGGHYHPTTTPVPVIVIPPKTGDMTIWQSILHFLGIR